VRRSHSALHSGAFYCSSLRHLPSGHYQDEATGAGPAHGRTVSALQIQGDGACSPQNIAGGGRHGVVQGVSVEPLALLF